MKRKVLIVDDDEEMCEEMNDILADEGYTVTTAFDGLRGIWLIEANEYDVILLDIKMPGIGGYDILKRVKEKKPWVQVIVLTGRPLVKRLAEGEEEEIFEEDKKNHLLKLANCVINKPFDVAKVIAKVDELTRERCFKL
jgi:DNA-binding response OmpR family regulator